MLRARHMRDGKRLQEGKDLAIKIAIYISCDHSCYNTENQDSARLIVLEIDSSPCVSSCISIVVYL
jgi:hypothetical protein